jgi:outer membrane protein
MIRPAVVLFVAIGGLASWGGAYGQASAETSLGAGAWAGGTFKPADSREPLRTPSADEVLAQRQVEEMEADDADAIEDTAPEAPPQDGTIVVTEESPEGEAEAEITAPIELETQLPSSNIGNFQDIKLDKFYEAMNTVEPSDRIPMSLLECISIALQHNQDIEIAELDPLRADGTILSAQGEFDPILSSTWSYTEAEQSANAQTVVFGGISSIESYTTDFNLGLQGRLPWGTEYGVQFQLNDSEDTFNDFIEEWSGGVTYTLSQPLLRGRGKAVNLARIRQAQNSRIASEAAFHLAIMNTLAETVQSYWDLVGAEENIRVRYKSVDNAERLRDITERRLDIGTAAPLDVVQAKAGIATRQSDLISAISQFRDAGDRLKRVMNFQDNGRIAAAPIVPTDRPNPDLRDVSVETSIDTALTNRPELLQAEISIDNAEIAKQVARNDMLPQLDVSGSYFHGGRGRHESDVFDAIEDATDTSFNVSITGQLPLRNRAARGAYHSAQIDVQDAEVQQRRLIQDLVLNVRLAARNVETNRILVESTKQARIVQEANLSAEEQRLKLGLTTNFQVLQIEEDLTNAEVQEAQAQVNLEKALIELELAEGVLLDNLGIEFEPPEPVKPVSIIKSVLPWQP